MIAISIAINYKNTIIINAISRQNFTKINLAKIKSGTNIQLLDISNLQKKIEKRESKKYIKYIFRFLNIFLIRKISNSKLKNVDEVFIFNDYSQLDRLITVFKHKSAEISLIEEGESVYNERRKSFNFLGRDFLFSIFPTRFAGQKKFIDKIYSKSIFKLDISVRKKGKLLNDIFSIGNVDNKFWLDLFPELNDILKPIQKINNRIDNKVILIVTQPIDYRNFISEKIKLQIYEQIIYLLTKKKYNEIVLKPHPAENTDYKKYFINNIKVSVINRNFPMELINNFIRNPFYLCVSLFSSSTGNIKALKKINVIETINDLNSLNMETIEKIFENAEI